LFHAPKFQDDIQHCLGAVDALNEKVPYSFVDVLISAEDHRSSLHLGVDPIAMIRAFLVRIFKGKIEGASTIEQQFVRTITGRFERTISRKVREQALAIAVSRRRSKYAIASAYLSVAFYGTGCVGLKGLYGLPLNFRTVHLAH
jgi:penicillin-binding protein 1A